MKASVILLLFAALAAQAQGTLEDYQRAERVFKGSYIRLVSDGSVTPGWIGRSPRFWYVKRCGDSKEFLFVDTVTKTRGSAFDHEKLAASLSSASGKRFDRDKLPFDAITFSNDGKALGFDAEGSHWGCDLTMYKCLKQGPAKPPRAISRFGGRGIGGGMEVEDEAGRDPGLSPDGVYTAFVRDHNLWVRTIVAGQEFQFTTDGTAEQPYATGWRNLGDFAREQTGIAGSVPRTRQVIVNWSPDSTKIATFRLDMRGAPPAYALQVLPPNRFLPIAYEYNYAYPAAPVLPTAAPLLYNVKTRKCTPIQFPPEELLYGGGMRFDWYRNNFAVRFRHIVRGHSRIQLLKADAETGVVTTLLDESSKDYVEAAKFQARMINDGEEMLVSSERDGWNHLYLHSAKGTLVRQLTKGEWAVRSIDYVDTAERAVFFSAGGKEPGDPYLRRVYRVGLDGTGLKLLTPEDADHTADFSPDGKHFVDTYSRVDLPPVSVLRSAVDGTVELELEKTDIEKLKASGWKQPERFSAKGRDGKTDIYGVMWRPATFDPARKYAIIEQIYAGPQGFFAPATFDGALRNGCQMMSELGALCIMIDGMGTDGRSHAFHAVAYKNLGDGGLPDHIAVIKHLAATRPYMDLSRVGIYGHSAGGYNSTHAMLVYPEFYKVAVSSAGNHDHRLDKAGWVEQWMGYPAGKWYEEQSNITLAPKLHGKLMLAVGDLDDNVTPVSTLKLAAALVQAEKDFELVIMPNAAHSFTNSPYFIRRRWDFLTRHLLGVNPPENYRIKSSATSAPAPSTQ